MNWKPVETVSEFASGVLMTALSLALVVAYGFLFSVFRPDPEMTAPAVAVEQAEVPADESLVVESPDF